MKSAPTIEFKGTNLSLMVLQATLRSGEPDAVAAALEALCGPTPDFFSGEPTVFDLAELGADASVDWTGLLPLLRRYSISPLGVRNAGPAQGEAARSAGLILVEDAEIHARAPARSPEPTPPAAEPEPVPEVSPAPPVAQAAPAPAAPPVPPPPSGSIIVDRPLRSGQQVYARGGDVVVLAMVNPGAEVIADGNIHVYAPLRGRALAGAQGNTEARILTTCFEAELTSIAGVYRTFESGTEKALTGQPVQVRLENEPGSQHQRLVLEALTIR